MGHSAAKRHFPTRVSQRRSGWRVATSAEHKLKLVPRPPNHKDWGVIGAQPACEYQASEIPEGYKSAIALLRSLRNVSESEINEKKEAWELLSQALEEDRYH